MIIPNKIKFNNKRKRLGCFRKDIVRQQEVQENQNTFVWLIPNIIFMGSQIESNSEQQ